MTTGSGYSILPGRQTSFCSGASAGGYGAWRMIISHPDAFDAALFMAGAYIPSLRELKILENAGMRLWICHGRRDECVPFDMVIRPILPILQGMPGTELYLPDFVRRANGCVASNLSGIQMGQHCINDEMQENLMFLDGTPMDPLHPEGFIELQQMVKRYQITDMSLQKIYAILFQQKISKGQQLTNWEAPQLTESQQRYAAIDAWACLRIYERLLSGTFIPEQSPYYHEVIEQENQ